MLQNQQHEKGLNRKSLEPLVKVDIQSPSLFLIRCGLLKPEVISTNKEEVGHQATAGFKTQLECLQKKI